MKEKNKTIEIAIDNLDKVNNLSELEQIIKEELTIKLLNAIQEELNRRKKKTKALRRKYKSRGAIEEATEQNHKLDKLNISMENFSNMMNNDIESDAPKYFVRKEETYNQKVKRITHEIVETDYFMDKKTKKVFYSYVESNSSKERLIILYELANTYADYIKEVTNTKEMTKNLQEEQKIKAKTQRYRRETFQSILEQEKEPTEEELLERIELLTSDIYNARETLKHLQELVKIEKEYLSEIRELERTNEVLIDNNEFIEPKNKTETYEEMEEVSLKEAIKFCIQSKRCRCILIFEGIIYATIAVLATYEISLLESLNISSIFIGIIFALLNIVSSLASKKQQIFQEKFKNRTLTVLGLSLSISCIIAGAITYAKINIVFIITIILIMYIIKYMMVGLYNVLLIKYLSNFTNEKIDTKIFAIDNLSASLLSVIFGIIGSGLLEIMTISKAMIVFSIFVLIIISITLLYMKNKVGLNPNEYSELELKYDKKVK